MSGVFCDDFKFKSGKIPGDREMYDEAKICYVLRKTILWLNPDLGWSNVMVKGYTDYV